MKHLYRQAKSFFDKYEKYLFPITMAIGFVVDTFTLRRIDLKIENLIIISYLSLAVFSIIYLNTYKKKIFKNSFLVWLNLIAPFILQYAFGALFSAFMVFYARSATLLVSWPFLLILLSLLLGNEFFRQRYERLYFHLGILYIALFAYAVFALPLLVNKIGVWVFLGSGLLSLILISLVIYLLYKIDQASLQRNKRRLIITLAFIYCLFNFLYFSNMIPPIPLAMKAGGVYHNITRVNNDYRLFFEKPRWYEFWKETSHVYHWQTDEKIYVFSSIFAPTKFNEKIYHRWLYYDEPTKTWIKTNDLSFSISGGRDNGYRGYSYKTTIQPGKWRVDVITDTEQVLGRIRFEVRETKEIIELEER